MTEETKKPCCACDAAPKLIFYPGRPDRHGAELRLCRRLRLLRVESHLGEVRSCFKERSCPSP